MQEVDWPDKKIEEIAMKEYVGDVFYQETKYHRGKLPDSFPDWSKLPEPYKHYRSNLVVTLDPPLRKGGVPLWDVISGRRSVRNYMGSPVTRQELSQLLWACQGITAHTEQYALRSASSASAVARSAPCTMMRPTACWAWTVIPRA